MNPRIPRWLVTYLDTLSESQPDEIIAQGERWRKTSGSASKLNQPFLRRWFVIPKNRWLNIYYHNFVRSDDDRALHDHPWANLSHLVHGAYIEHTIDAGGIHRYEIVREGTWK